LHTVSYLLPGETLEASAKLPDSQKAMVSPSFFIMTNPKGVSTSAYFTWFLPSSFSDEDAEAATLQLRQNIVERPLTLTPGKSLPMFSISNRFGGVFAAYLEFKRSLPAPPAQINGTNEPIQAKVRIRNHTGYLPSLTYTAKVPSGYRLQATASEGQGHTDITENQGTTEYHSTWFDLPGMNMRTDASGHVDDYQARQTALKTQLKALYEQGPFEVVLGKPREVFAVTNANGSVFEGKLELVGPPEQSNP
jgi:hypothetical protein